MTKLRTLFLTLFMYLSALSADASDADILRRYPACDYSVIDTISVSRSLNYERDVGDSAQLQSQTQQLLSRLMRQAEQKDARYVAITERRVPPFRNGKSTLTIVAELLSECKNGWQGEGKLTPYNELVHKQYSLGDNKSSVEFTVQMQIGNASHKPDIGDNSKVSPDSGLYGIQLGVSKDAVIKRFGTPTFTFTPNKQYTILLYGRDHALTFNRGQLIRASVGESLFSAELTNFLPFDTRFDDREWQLSNGLEKNQILSTSQDTRLETVQSEKVSLTTLTETYRFGDDPTEDTQVTGFVLSLDEYALTGKEAAVDETHRNAVLDYLTNVLFSKASPDALQLSDIPSEPVGVSEPIGGYRYYLFGQFVVVKSAGDFINRIFVNPNYLRQFEQSDWVLGPFSSRQTEADAVGVAGEKASLQDHMLAMTTDTYSLEILMARNRGTFEVYSADVRIFH